MAAIIINPIMKEFITVTFVSIISLILALKIDSVWGLLLQALALISILLWQRECYKNK